MQIKENLMRKIVRSAGLAAILLLTVSSVFAAPPPAAKGVPGTVVIVFKDGHRQAYNLADIDRVEFPASDQAASMSSASGPSRGHFIGRWECGNGGTFYITLEEDGNARRSIGDEHGRWSYVNGEALIKWDDGVADAIRKVGGGYQKSAYTAGKAFTDVPANVTSARNISPKPI
jgi:hypothetical protein